MNSQLRRLWVVALVGLVLSFATRAGAQPVVDLPRIEVVTPPPPSEQPPKPPEGPNERSVVAAIRSHEEEPSLSRVVAEHIRRRGIPALEGATTESALACTIPECLESLVRHENVGFLFTAQIDESSGDPAVITMTLFDVVRRAALQETGTCSHCNKVAIGLKLNEIADELITRCRDARNGASVPNQTLQTQIVLPSLSAAPPAPRTPEVAPPQPAAAPAPAAQAAPPLAPPPPPAKKGFFAKLPKSRRILTGVLGGLAGAALITSVILTATDGLDTSLGCDLRTDVLQDKCVLKNKPLYATGYALTGALAVGIGFTLFWPSKASQGSASEVH